MQTQMNPEIENFLLEKGAGTVRFVDISNLPDTQTHGFPRAVVFCIALTKEFVLAIRDGTHSGPDEFVDKEHETDRIADQLAIYIQSKGYKAFSQSEESIEANGYYDEATMTSLLPHKTIARLAGIGFIGKNNLIITKDYGCGFSMCTVLTDAPVQTENPPLLSPKCGECNKCKVVCENQAIHGNEWAEAGGRDAVVDVFKCACQLKCMVNCPYTLDYALQVSI